MWILILASSKRVSGRVQLLQKVSYKNFTRKLLFSAVLIFSLSAMEDLVCVSISQRNCFFLYILSSFDVRKMLWRPLSLLWLLYEIVLAIAFEYCHLHYFFMIIVILLLLMLMSALFHILSSSRVTVEMNIFYMTHFSSLPSSQLISLFNRRAVLAQLSCHRISSHCGNWP